MRRLLDFRIGSSEAGSLDAGRRAAPLRRPFSELVGLESEASPPARRSAQHKLARQALAIEAEEARSAGALGFMARMLVQATLPHRRLRQTSFDRENGALRLSVYAHPNVGLPYGRYPRLLLIWLATEAVRTRSPLLHLGPTLSSFMASIGVRPTGGSSGTIHRLRDQMKRLFSATFAYTYDASAAGQWREQGFRLARDVQLWWSPKDSHQEALPGSTVELSGPFFEALIERPVPVDLRAIRTLRSSLALDIYCWLTYRHSYLRRPTEIPWQALRLQFGSGHGRTRDFKVAFLRQAQAVLKVYPRARVAVGNRGLILRPASPHVRRLRT